MHHLPNVPSLKPGDSVELIAPASRCSDQLLSDIIALLKSWQLNCIVEKDIFGSDILCANTDSLRYNALKKSLYRKETKAVICARGGYGSMRLIPDLAKEAKPSDPKLFVGMSDITALNLFLEKHWQWPCIHGAPALDKFSNESILALKELLFSEKDLFTLFGKGLNSAAEKNQIIDSTITGGNLCLVQNSIGTLWEIEGQHKIIFLEDIGERGYRIDRMLEHLRQANVFKNATAVLFGDFTGGNEPDGSSLIQPILNRFAESVSIPVLQVEGIGHGQKSLPIPLGLKVSLHLGKEPKIVYHLGF